MNMNPWMLLVGTCICIIGEFFVAKTDQERITFGVGAIILVSMATSVLINWIGR